MKQRNGMSYRLLDGERFTVAFGGAFICDGSHRRPRVDIIDRPNHHRSLSIPLPLVRFRRCYRFRRVGGMLLWRAWVVTMRRLCMNPQYRRGW